MKPIISRSRSRRRAGAFGAASALFIGSATGLLGSLLAAGPAGADSPFGGFTINALAEGSTVQYEQPNFPLPATPTLEFDEGYAQTTNNFGPTGSATASVFFPGQVVANAGPELALLVPGAPLPPAPVWPLDAITDYPQTPNTKSLDEPGANMDANSDANGSTATSTVGDDAATAGGNGTQPTQAPSGSGNPFASSSSLFGLGVVSGSSSSTTTSTAAVATATATVSGISVLGGFINIGAVTSTATASSDGNNGTVSGSTQVANVSIAGQQVVITANGIQAAGKSTPLALPIAAINSLLKEVGITISVTNATDKVSGPSASRTLDGLRISVDLTILDNAVNKLSVLVPKQILSSLPVALPNQQVITLDLGTVSVSSAASPAFVADDSGGSSDTGTSTTDTFPNTSSNFGGTGSTDFGGTGTTGSFGGTGFTTPSTTSPTGTGGSGSGGNGTGGTGGLLASNTAPVFGGIGSGAVLIGLVAAAVMAYAYKRADDASELVGAACADGDPLGSRFSDDDITDEGGFA